jgi:hypothetical protein
MSTQVDPAKNLTALLLGTSEFMFSENATSKSDAQSRGYLDFGNIISFQVMPENKTAEHKGSYRGVKRTDKRVNTETAIRYKLKADEWNLQNLKILFGATDGTSFSQSAISAVAGTAFGFTAVPAVIGNWYDILDAAGNHVINLTTVTFAGPPSLAEGTDFELDLLMGRVRFLTAQSADLTPTITCPAIAAGDDYSFFGLIPAEQPVRTGYGKLVVYDETDNNHVVWRHEDFSCDISLDTAGDVTGSDFSDLTIDVLVTTDKGTLQGRQANLNAGLVAA